MHQDPKCESETVFRIFNLNNCSGFLFWLVEIVNNGVNLKMENYIKDKSYYYGEKEVSELEEVSNSLLCIRKSGLS